MKKILALAVASTSIASLAVADDQLLGLSAKVGLLFPVDSETRDAHINMPTVGFAYTLRELNSAAKYSAGLDFSVDFYSRGDFRHVPLLINYVGYLNNGLYYTAGLGVGFVQRPTAGGTETLTRFAGAVGIGYFWDKPKSGGFVELRFLASQASEVNGVAATIGYRF